MARTRTLADIQKQIAELTQEAEALKRQEVGPVIARIREAIAHYGLTARDLFGKYTAPAGGVRKRKSTKSPSPIKYRDDQGNTWVGMGKRPDWLKAAIAAGSTADDFLVK